MVMSSITQERERETKDMTNGWFTSRNRSSYFAILFIIEQVLRHEYSFRRIEKEMHKK